MPYPEIVVGLVPATIRPHVSTVTDLYVDPPTIVGIAVRSMLLFVIVIVLAADGTTDIMFPVIFNPGPVVISQPLPPQYDYHA